MRRKLVRGEGDLSVLLSYYRYASVAVTSLLYAVWFSGVPVQVRAAVILCLLVEAFLFLRAYRAARSGGAGQKLLIGAEIIGLLMLLVLTGGLHSPFIWYAINPILLSASLRPTYICWAASAVFVTVATLTHRFALHTPADQAILWLGAVPFLTIFILITLMAQMYSKSIGRLKGQAAALRDCVRHIHSLYEAVEAVSDGNEPEEMASLFASYGKALTRATKVVVWVRVEARSAGEGEVEDEVNGYAVRGPKDEMPEDVWHPYVRELFERGFGDEPFSICERGVTAGGDRLTMLTVPIRGELQEFGLLSAMFNGDGRGRIGVRETLQFLASLCAAELERYSLRSAAEELLLVREKDRIARELHDRVAQNLFGVVHNLGKLSRSNDFEDSVRERLDLCQRMSRRSMKDLRRSIYSMSDFGTEPATFLQDWRNYLTDITRLNGVEMDFAASTDVEPPDEKTRSAICRITKEAAANAIRHGECSYLRVAVYSDDGGLQLEVEDDGCGFEVPGPGVGDRGTLGLTNMRELARSLGAELTIDSAPEEGTTVRLHLENVNQSASEKEGAPL